MIQLAKIFFIALLLLCVGACSKSNYVSSKKKPIDQMYEVIKQSGYIDYYIDGYEVSSEDQVQRATFTKVEPIRTSLVNEFIEEHLTDFPDSLAYVFIHYYPGKDINNSTGGATRNDIGKRNEKLNKKISGVRKMGQLSIYKDNEGLSRWDKNRNYIKDSDLIFTKTFFQNHYPGTSYMIWHKSGVFYSYFGESMHSAQIADIDMFLSLGIED